MILIYYVTFIKSKVGQSVFLGRYTSLSICTDHVFIQTNTANFLDLIVILTVLIRDFANSFSIQIATACAR